MASIAFIAGVGVINDKENNRHEEEMNKYKYHYRQSFIQPIPLPVMKPGTEYCQAPEFIDKNYTKLDYNTLSNVDRRKGIRAALRCKNDKDGPCLKYLRKITYNNHTFTCGKKAVFKLPKEKK